MVLFITILTESKFVIFVEVESMLANSPSSINKLDFQLCLRIRYFTIKLRNLHYFNENK